MLSNWELLARLAVAAGLGAALGLERELRDHEAGIRTNLLVCLGSAVFTVMSAYGFEGFLHSGATVVRADPTRIAAQIVTGIGFLGAGAIIRDGLNVRGLTTAANMWVVAAIGIACGAGYYAAALLGAGIALAALWPLRIVADRTVDRWRRDIPRIVLDVRPEAVDRVLDELGRRKLTIEQLSVEREGEQRHLTFRLDRADPKLAVSLSELDGVIGASWGG
ncbi:MAG TPA: MgtC/SapB family protein [Gaiellaceae bacterium]|jgi:putative Mg2+ transporter-C (MgtC) family protein